jgi:uncharacterized protein (DUF362 family)
MDPDPHNAGVLAFGTNPVSVDAIAATLMGFNIDMIPVIRQSFDTIGFPLTSASPSTVQSVSNHASWNGSLEELRLRGDHLAFRPHFGWVNHIEW